MATVYILRSTDSDLTASGALANRNLNETTATLVDFSFGNLSVGTDTILIAGFTESGIPGADGITGNYSIEVDVNTGNTACQLSVQLHRVNASGTIQTSGTESSEQQATAGVKTFNFTNANLGTWASGDRLRADLRVRTTHSHGNTAAPIIGQNTTDSQYTAPWTAQVTVELAGSTDTSANTSATLDLITQLSGASSAVASNSGTLTVTGDGTPGYATLFGQGSTDYIWADDAEVGSITGDFEVVALIESDDYSTTAHPNGIDFVTQWHAGDLCFQFGMNNDSLRLRVSENGSTIFNAYNNGSNLTWTADQHYWVRVTFDIDNGASQSVATFYRSTDSIDTAPASVSWTNVGSASAAIPTSLHDSDGNFNLGSAEDAVGGFTDRTLDGKFYLAYIWSDISRTTQLANPDFRDDMASADWSTLSGDDDFANTWTLANGTTYTDATQAGENELNATVASVASNSAGLDITTQLDASASMVAASSAALGQTHRLVSDLSSVAATSADISLAHNMVASISSVAAVSGTLFEGERLNGTLSAAASLSASLVQTHALVATASSVASATGSLSLTELVELDGVAVIVARVTGSLSQTQRIVPSSIEVLAGTQATLTLNQKLSGAVSVVSAVSAELSTSGRVTLSGTVSGVASNTASLSQTHQPNASVSTTASASASLHETVRLGASTSAQTSVSTSLSQTHRLVASPIAVASSTAALSIEGQSQLAASVSAVVSTSASLDLTVQLSASASALASISGTIDVPIELAGQLSAVSLLDASLTILAGVELDGSIASIASVSGTLNVVYYLNGELAGVAALEAALTNTEPVTRGTVTLTTVSAGGTNLASALVGTIASDSDSTDSALSSSSLGSVELVTSVP